MFKRLSNWVFSKPKMESSRKEGFLIRVKGTNKYVVPVPELSVHYVLEEVDDPFDPALLLDAMAVRYVRGSHIARGRKLEVFKVPIHVSTFYNYPAGISPK